MPNPKMIGFGELPAFQGPSGLPFNGIPMQFASFLSKFIGIALGNGQYVGPLAAGTSGGWTVTDIAGTGAVAQNNEGALTVTTGTTDENSTQLQNKTAVFKYSTTKKLWFFARVKVSTASTTGALIGLCSIDTTVITAAAGAVDVDDGIFFYKDATATDWTLHVRKDSTSTSVAGGLTIADDTYAIIGFTVEAGVIKWFAKADSNDALDDIADGPNFLGSGTVVANTNAPDDTDLALTLVCGQEGGTTARVLTVDWAFAVEEKA
jgi:hypothetical protein